MDIVQWNIQKSENKLIRNNRHGLHSKITKLWMDCYRNEWHIDDRWARDKMIYNYWDLSTYVPSSILNSYATLKSYDLTIIFSLDFVCFSFVFFFFQSKFQFYFKLVLGYYTILYIYIYILYSVSISVSMYEIQSDSVVKWNKIVKSRFFFLFFHRYMLQ